MILTQTKLIENLKRIGFISTLWVICMFFYHLLIFFAIDEVDPESIDFAQYIISGFLLGLLFGLTNGFLEVFIFKQRFRRMNFGYTVIVKTMLFVAAFMATVILFILIKNYKTKFYNQHIYMYGNKGTQKTTLAWWVARELLKQRVSIKYVLMNDLIKELQDETFKEEILIQPYYDVDCLIIDRCFSKEQITLYKSGYQIPFLDNFLRKRIDQLHKSIIFISNINIYQIADNGFTKDIEDLIIRKIKVFDSDLLFEDHYSLKDDFNSINLWS